MQNELGNVSVDVNNFTVSENNKGIDYKFKWFFGLVAEQEKNDARFLREKSNKLQNSAAVLQSVANKIGNQNAKSTILEQIKILQDQSNELNNRANEKERNLSGLFSWLANLFGAYPPNINSTTSTTVSIS